MEITLKFTSWEEHDHYIKKARKHGKEDISVFNEETKIDVLKRNKRRPWTEYEMNELKVHFPYKSMRWLAAALQRPQHSVANQIYRMRKAGWEFKKNNKQGKVSDL